MVAQAAGHTLSICKFGAGSPAIFWLRMNQESGAAVEIRAHDVDATLGLVPVLDDYVFEFFVEKIFSRFFECRFHFDEIRQDAGGAEVVGLPVLNGGEEALDAFG